MRSAQHNEVAILVFANSSTEELNHKRISQSSGFFDTLTEQTIATVQKTGLPFFHVTEREQNGNSFGERFSNAIQSVFDKGYERVITIGNDTPHLKAPQIQDTAKQLAAGKTVLGPSADGGFYLMGLQKAQFNISDFEKLPWQTEALFKEVSVLLDIDNEQTIRLQTLFDIDDLYDLKLFVNRFKNIPEKLFRIIQSLLPKAVENFRLRFLFLENQLPQTFYNKGSPLVLHA